MIVYYLASFKNIHFLNPYNDLLLLKKASTIVSLLGTGNNIK
jgi:hypothetical protein